MCICICMHVWIYVYTCACVGRYTRTFCMCTYVHVCIHVYIHVCIHACICIYIYIHRHVPVEANVEHSLAHPSARVGLGGDRATDAMLGAAHRSQAGPVLERPGRWLPIGGGGGRKRLSSNVSPPLMCGARHCWGLSLRDLRVGRWRASDGRSPALVESATYIGMCTLISYNAGICTGISVCKCVCKCIYTYMCMYRWRCRCRNRLLHVCKRIHEQIHMFKVCM